jgi:hypothetical protein
VSGKNLKSNERDRRDIDIINRNAERLNREALDTLEYQQLSGVEGNEVRERRS